MRINETYTDESFTAALLQHVREEMARLVETEAEAAAERVRERARQIAPRLVMDLMTNFNVYRNGTDIVIQVCQDPRP